MNPLEARDCARLFNPVARPIARLPEAETVFIGLSNDVPNSLSAADVETLENLFKTFGSGTRSSGLKKKVDALQAAVQGLGSSAFASLNSFRNLWLEDLREVSHEVAVGYILHILLSRHRDRIVRGASKEVAVLVEKLSRRLTYVFSDGRIRVGRISYAKALAQQDRLEFSHLPLLINFDPLFRFDREVLVRQASSTVQTSRRGAAGRDRKNERQLASLKRQLDGVAYALQLAQSDVRQLVETAPSQSKRSKVPQGAKQEVLAVRFAHRLVNEHNYTGLLVSSTLAEARALVTNMPIGLCFVVVRQPKISKEAVTVLQYPDEVRGAVSHMAYKLGERLPPESVAFNRNLGILLRILAELGMNAQEQIATMCSGQASEHGNIEAPFPEAVRSQSIFPKIDVGIGELARLRQRYLGWNYGGLAKIINIMPGTTTRVFEERTQETIQRERAETTTELQTSSERIESTSRELNKAIEKEVTKDMALSAGINATYTSVGTKVSAAANFSAHYSSSEKETTNEIYAQDLSMRATEALKSEKLEVIEREARELLRRTHETTTTGAQDPSYALAYTNDGIEFEIVSFGKRLMLETYVPEPAVGLLTQFLGKRIEAPEPFEGGLDDIEDSLWSCLQTRYPEVKLPLPPPEYLTIPFKWTSTPDEEADHSDELVASENIEIPEGYRLSRVKGCVTVAGNLKTATKDKTEYRVALNGFETRSGVYKRENESYAVLNSQPFEGLDHDIPAEGKVALTAVFFNAHDKVASINARIECRREPSAYLEWKQDVFQKIRAVDRNRLDTFEINKSRSPEKYEIEFNASRISGQLRKWFSKALYGKSLSFGVVESDPDTKLAEPSFREDAAYRPVYDFDQCLEWAHMRYELLGERPQGEKSLEGTKNAIDTAGRIESDFLRAGGVRISVPVGPKKVGWVLHFLEMRSDAEPDADIIEILRASAEEATASAPESFKYFDVLGDLFRSTPEVRFVEGVGKLRVVQDSNVMTALLPEFETLQVPPSIWLLSSKDRGREILLEQEIYTISDVDADGVISVDRPVHVGGDFGYLIGGQRLGAPWKATVPNGEVKLLTRQEFEALRLEQ